MTDHGTDQIGARIRAAAEGVSAPLALQHRVADSPPRPGPNRLNVVLVGAVLALFATVTAVLQPEPPTVQRVAAVALDRPERAAPEGSDFLPGFSAVGARSDVVGGRDAETVMYQRGDVGVHYTLVDGRPLDLPDGRAAEAGDLDLVLVRDGDVSIVAWHAYGKTCVLASRTATPDEVADALRSRAS